MTQILPLKNEDLKEFALDPSAWLTRQAKARELTFLLIHADDGVIWGRFQDGSLTTSGDAFPEVAVALRAVTLQQARLFGLKGELHIWRTETGFSGRYLTESDKDGNTIEEMHLLWGEASDPPGPQDGFTLMRDGVQGLLHAPPIELPDPAPRRGRRAALCVRHYLDYDGQGQAYVALSRLVKLVEVT
jgi:CRISPR-associated protein (TIGR03984 family)